jgi:hypothetical protein
MAPTLEPDAVVLYAWEVFTAIKNGQPCIGARLFTYEANTSTPKAAYHDPYYLSPHTNPIIMNDQGQNVIWLDGFYHLRLEDADGVQLWDVPSYEFAGGATPTSGGLVSGMTEAVNVTPGAGSAVVSVPGLVPLGYRVEGAIVKVTTDFGASQGLSSIAIGDSTLMDRWGTVALATGQQTGQVNFRGADRPIAATAYSVLLSALGGLYDGGGRCTVRAFWSSITGWS